MAATRKSIARKLPNKPLSWNGITVEFENITPAIAEQYLKLNKRNRNIRPSHVRELAESMIEGQFALNGDTICFDSRGRLLDGQHRLSAIISSGVAQTMLVVRGLQPKVHSTKDTGAKRGPSHVLQIEGFKNSVLLASTIASCIDYENGGLWQPGHGRKATNNDDILAYARANKGLLESVQFVQDLVPGRSYGVTNTMLATLIYQAKGLESEAREFVRQFVEMDGLRKGSPVLALIRRIERIRAQGAAHKPHPTYFAALLVKSFNAYVAGEKMQTLMFRPDGSRPEAPPVIATA